VGAILTLQLPLRGKVVPLATSTAPGVILQFCQAIYAEYCQRERLATDELEAAIFRVEIERLRRILALVCPEMLAEVEDDGA
jgi:hypothetical protein